MSRDQNASHNNKSEMRLQIRRMLKFEK